MIYNILFAVVGIVLIVFGVSMMNLDDRVLLLMRRINNIDDEQHKDARRLCEALRRIQVLEDLLEEKLNDSGGEE
jgi:hypothetical protein